MFLQILSHYLKVVGVTDLPLSLPRVWTEAHKYCCHKIWSPFHYPIHYHWFASNHMCVTLAFKNIVLERVHGRHQSVPGDPWHTERFWPSGPDEMLAAYILVLSCYLYICTSRRSLLQGSWAGCNQDSCFVPSPVSPDWLQRFRSNSGHCRELCQCAAWLAAPSWARSRAPALL
jgi:hypothetical protein